MRPGDRALANSVVRGLRSYEAAVRPLPGIQQAKAREVLVEQLVESIRRIRYIHTVREQSMSPLRADPSSALFHPIKAAIRQIAAGNREEAFWLVFLSVHFGRHGRTGWRLLRDVYGGLGQRGIVWSWTAVSRNPMAFRAWLTGNLTTLGGGDGVARHFGNHRKYQSLDAETEVGTGNAVQTYVNWVRPAGSQHGTFQTAVQAAGGDRCQAFDDLYESMDDVASFGRTARFDFLTMVGKLGLAEIEPGRPYMQGATGPLAGARLLFGGAKEARLPARTVDEWVQLLGTHLGIRMQVMEDALCNWQKSPSVLVRFRG